MKKQNNREINQKKEDNHNNVGYYDAIEAPYVGTRDSVPLIWGPSAFHLLAAVAVAV